MEGNKYGMHPASCRWGYPAHAAGKREALPLHLQSWRQGQGCLWVYGVCGDQIPPALSSALEKKEAKQKHSQGPVGWLLKFFMHSDVRDVHFQSHSAVELKSSCKYFYTEPDRAWTSIMKKQEFLNKVHLKYWPNYLKSRINFCIFIFSFMLSDITVLAEMTPIIS